MIHINKTIIEKTKLVCPKCNKSIEPIIQEFNYVEYVCYDCNFLISVNSDLYKKNVLSIYTSFFRDENLKISIINGITFFPNRNTFYYKIDSHEYKPLDLGTIRHFSFNQELINYIFSILLNIIDNEHLI